jgi:hypothetical protein
MPVILATEEAEIRKIKVWGRLGKKLDFISEIPNAKRGWASGSSGRGAAKKIK